jgi:pimeloyl-ACP methyl ester carboxylesterase
MLRRWVALGLVVAVASLVAVVLVVGGGGGGDDGLGLPDGASLVDLTTDDGFTLVAESYEGGPDWVLLGHMFTDDRRTWDPIAAGFAERGYSVLVWDFRCHGESPCAGERFSDGVADIWRDWNAALDHAVAEGAASVVAIGASMGGTSAIQVAADRDEIVAVGSISGPNRFKGLDALEHYERVTVPKLFIVGADDMAAPKFSRRFHEEATGPSRLEMLPTALHGNVLAVDAEFGPGIQTLLYAFAADPLGTVGDVVSAVSGEERR